MIPQRGIRPGCLQTRLDGQARARLILTVAWPKCSCSFCQTFAGHFYLPGCPCLACGLALELARIADVRHTALAPDYRAALMARTIARRIPDA